MLKIAFMFEFSMNVLNYNMLATSPTWAKILQSFEKWYKDISEHFWEIRPNIKAHQAATILLFGLKFNFRTRDISVGFRKRDSLQLSGMDSFFSGHSLSSFHWEVPDSFSFWMSPKEEKKKT